MLAMLSLSECLEPGSFHSKIAFLLELSTGKLQKCQKHTVFDAKSLQTVELPTGSSKYVKNWVLFKKHRILLCVLKTPLKLRFFQNPGAQNLRPMVQWSFFLILNLKFVTLKHIFRLVPSSMVFCRTKYQQTPFRALLVQNSGRNCISGVELWRNLSINGKLPGFEFGGFPVLRKYGALN